ncbi:hypothetical protein ACP4OV_026538 [Aristida adscensionis]
MSSLRVATSGGVGKGALGFALGRLGGGGVGGAPGLVIRAAAAVAAAPPRGRRAVSATPSAGAPLPGDQQPMEQPKQQPQHPPKEKSTRGDKHKTLCVMTHSFGEGYATRSEEEGFGGVYGRDDDHDEHPGAEAHHRSHPEYDTTQGSEVKEKEKARNFKDAAHTA